MDDDERKGRRDRGVPQGGEVHLRIVSGGRSLIGPAGNTLIDTIHDLQMGYTKWLTRQSLKEQSFRPMTNRLRALVKRAGGYVMISRALRTVWARFIP